MNRLQAAEQLRRALQMFAATLTEEQALEIATVYPAWEAGKTYAVGDIISYGANSVGDPQLYKVVQAHTSQTGWEPPNAASLWSITSDPAEEWPEWSQPLGAHDAYAAGAKVSHNGKHWTSDLDGNVWEPGTYGWTEASE